MRSPGVELPFGCPFEATPSVLSPACQLANEECALYPVLLPLARCRAEDVHHSVLGEGENGNDIWIVPTQNREVEFFVCTDRRRRRLRLLLLLLLVLML